MVDNLLSHLGGAEMHLVYTLQRVGEVGLARQKLVESGVTAEQIARDPELAKAEHLGEGVEQAEKEESKKDVPKEDHDFAKFASAFANTLQHIAPRTATSNDFRRGLEEVLGEHSSLVKSKVFFVN